MGPPVPGQPGTIYCGVAHIIPLNPVNAASLYDRGFNVVAKNCIYSDSFVHEIGHNLSARHDAETDSNSQYNKGYRFYGSDGALYRTIMAYDPGFRIGYFSNPEISYLNVPIGVAGVADNVKAINSAAPYVAGYTNLTPIIWNTLVNLKRSENSNVQFSVSATGSYLSYQWQKNGVDIPGATGSKYQFYTSASDNKSKYRCVVSNPNGIAVTNEAILIVPPLGDYNGDGCVDELDKIVWRASFGEVSSGRALDADGNRDGVVDNADFIIWRKALGTGCF